MSLCLVLSLNRNNETLVFAVSGKSEWHPVSFCRQDDTLYHSRPDNEGYLTTESLTHVNSPPLAPRGSSQSRFGINHVLQGICWSLKITLLFLFCFLFSPFRRIWICKSHEMALRAQHVYVTSWRLETSAGWVILFISIVFHFTQAHFSHQDFLVASLWVGWRTILDINLPAISKPSQ